MSEGSMPARPRPQSIAPGRITVEDHLEAILRGVGPLVAYDQPVVESLGLTLHEDVTTQLDLPRHNSADVDGYAVLGTDASSRAVTLDVTLLKEQFEIR